MSGFTIDRVYPHPRERVWRALTEPEVLARWLMPNDFQPVLGHEFTFRTEPGPGFDGIVRCRVTEIEPPNRLAFTWVGGPIDTVVTFDLTECQGGTRMVMTQTGFRGFKARLVGTMLKAGSRTIYGKRLPETLDHLAGKSPEPPPAECDSHREGLIRRLLGILERKPR